MQFSSLPRFARLGNCVMCLICFLVHSRGQHTLFTVDPIRTYVGGLPRNMRTSTWVQRKTDAVKDFIGCLNDVRYNGYSLHHKGSKDIGRAKSRGEEKCFTMEC